MRIITRTNALYASTLLVTLCNAMMALILPWLVLQSTGSVITMGWIGALALGAVLAGSLACNTLIGWIGARRVVVLGYASNIVGIVGILYCFSQDSLPIPLLVAFVLVDSVLDSAAGIAVESRLPEIARSNRVPLTTLNATLDGLDNAGAIMGAASAGFLLSLVDPVTVLAIAAVVGVGAIFTFMPLMRYYRPGRTKVESPSMWVATKWIVGQPHLRNALIMIVVVMASVASLDDVLLPVFIDQTTKDPADIGYILAAYSIAAIISSFLYARYHQRADEDLLVRVGVFGIALFFLGLVLFTDPWTIMAVTFLSGLTSGALGPIIDTRFLKDTPKPLRLGMLAGVTTVGIGISPVMVFAHAWVIEAFSVQVLCLAAAASILAMVFLRITPGGARNQGAGRPGNPRP